MAAELVRFPSAARLATAALLCAVGGCAEEWAPGEGADSFAAYASDADGGEPAARDAAASDTTRADGRTWRHPVGACFDLPAGFEVEPIGGSCAFVPADARAANGETLVAAHFVFLPAPGIDAVDSSAFLAAARAEMATLAASAREIGEPEALPLADRAAIVLRYETAESGIPGRADLYATLHEGLAIGLIVVGHRARVEQDAAEMARFFATLRFAAPQRDQALASTWTRGESYVSGGFSMATEERLELAADGRYARSSQAAGGDASNSFDSDGDVETGRWFGGDGALLLCGDAGGVAAWSWRIVDGTLVLHDAEGRRSLWQ